VRIIIRGRLPNQPPPAFSGLDHDGLFIEWSLQADTSTEQSNNSMNYCNTS